MRRIILLFLLIGLLFISDSVQDISRQIAASNAPPVNTYSPEPGGHRHYLCKIDNILPHEDEALDESIRTTVEYTPEEGEGFVKSFDGEKSVELTELLRWLNYQGQACRCPAEYIVTTESGEVYGVNYTDGFARYGDSQTSLTEEQRKEVGKIMRWVYRHGEDVQGN